MSGYVVREDNGEPVAIGLDEGGKEKAAVEFWITEDPKAPEELRDEFFRDEFE